MNNSYESPEMTVLRFDFADIVTTSGYDFLDEGFGDEILWQ